MTIVKQLLDQKPAEIWSVAPDATVFTALQLMAERNIGALLVLKERALVGIFSERDYARKVILEGKSSRTATVGELMSHPVFFVRPEQTIEYCLALMTERRIRHLPVLQAHEIVGVVSIGDIAKAVISKQKVVIQDLERYITGDPRSSGM